MSASLPKLFAIHGFVNFSPFGVIIKRFPIKTFKGNMQLTLYTQHKLFCIIISALLNLISYHSVLITLEQSQEHYKQGVINVHDQQTYVMDRANHVIKQHTSLCVMEWHKQGGVKIGKMSYYHTDQIWRKFLLYLNKIFNDIKGIINGN